MARIRKALPTDDRPKQNSRNHISDFDSFVEQNFTKMKELSQLSRSELAEVAKQSCNLVEQLGKDFPGMNIIEMEAVLFKSRFNFKAAQGFAENLPTNKKRLEFFIVAKTQFDQHSSVDHLTGPGLLLKQSDLRFGKNCELEIAKYERLHKFDAETTDMTGISEEDDHAQLKRRVVILLIEELIPKFSELIPAKRAEFLALLTGMSKKGFEIIVPDHRRASNFDQTRNTASEWIEKLK